MSTAAVIREALRRWARARARRNPLGHGKTGTSLLLEAADCIDELVGVVAEQEAALWRLERERVLVTHFDWTPRPGESESDLKLLVNRGDWSVPWVRGAISDLFTRVCEVEAERDELVLQNEACGNAIVTAEATVARQAGVLRATYSLAMAARSAAAAPDYDEEGIRETLWRLVNAVFATAGPEAPVAESLEKDACMRCGSTEWADVDYSGCSNCREAPDVASDGVHTIPVPRGWTPEQAWEAITRGDMLTCAESSWANVVIRDGKFVELVPDG